MHSFSVSKMLRYYRLSCALPRGIFNHLKLLLTDLWMGLFSHQLSVVEYDPGTHDLKTLSLHYFEEPELRVCSCKDIDKYLSKCTSEGII